MHVRPESLRLEPDFIEIPPPSWNSGKALNSVAERGTREREEQNDGWRIMHSKPLDPTKELPPLRVAERTACSIG